MKGARRRAAAPHEEYPSPARNLFVGRPRTVRRYRGGGVRCLRLRGDASRKRENDATGLREDETEKRASWRKPRRNLFSPLQLEKRERGGSARGTLEKADFVPSFLVYGEKEVPIEQNLRGGEWSLLVVNLRDIEARYVCKGNLIAA